MNDTASERYKQQIDELSNKVSYYESAICFSQETMMIAAPPSGVAAREISPILVIDLLRQRDKLHRIVCDCLTAVGNGSGATDQASIEFLSGSPEEIRLEVSALKRQRDELLAKLSNHQREAAIGRAIERSAGELPEGWDLEIAVERGSATVRLFIPDHDTYIEDFGNDSTLAEEIDNAVNIAIAKSEKPAVITDSEGGEL